MINILNHINNLIQEDSIDVILNNKCLTTKIKCSSTLCSEKIIEFAENFNNLFHNESNNKNILKTNIIENNLIFEKACNKLEDSNLIQTNATKKFNKATITTSIVKCTKDKNYYIMRCYEYFIYIFDKKKQECYMIIKRNKKAITMINILLLTPYLMYGELYAVHGGLVNKNNINILINNSSLGGKTTFAILFASHGWNIITEETTYITKQGNILPYNIRNYFNIRVGTYLTFKDYFLGKNIINTEFLLMENKTNNELFDYGKKLQFSIDFDDIGKNIQLDNKEISHSLKVSIGKDKNIKIQKCHVLENVNSFLQLSLSPTVLLFRELLNYNNINEEERSNELKRIFAKTQCFIVETGFDYKDNYEYILNNINIKN